MQNKSARFFRNEGFVVLLLNDGRYLQVVLETNHKLPFSFRNTTAPKSFEAIIFLHSHRVLSSSVKCKERGIEQLYTTAILHGGYEM